MCDQDPHYWLPVNPNSLHGTVRIGVIGPDGLCRYRHLSRGIRSCWSAYTGRGSPNAGHSMYQIVGEPSADIGASLQLVPTPAGGSDGASLLPVPHPPFFPSHQPPALCAEYCTVCLSSDDGVAMHGVYLNNTTVNTKRTGIRLPFSFWPPSAISL